MNDDYTIAYLDQPAWDIIGQGITDYNPQQAGHDHVKMLCFVV